MIISLGADVEVDELEQLDKNRHYDSRKWTIIYGIAEAVPLKRLIEKSIQVGVMTVLLRFMIILYVFSFLLIGVSFVKKVDSKIIYPAIIFMMLEMITKILYLRELAIENKPNVIMGLSILLTMTTMSFIQILNTFYSNLKGNKIIQFLLFNYLLYAIFENVGLHFTNKETRPLGVGLCIGSNIFKWWFLEIYDNINFLYLSVI